MNNPFQSKKYKDNSRRYQNYRGVYKTQKGAKIISIRSQDKLSAKRNYMQFEDNSSEIPLDQIFNPIRNKIPKNPLQNAYIASLKRLKPTAESNYQNSLIKQDRQNNHDLFRSGTNILAKNQENFDNEVSANSNDSFWSQLQPDIESHKIDTQINKTDENEIRIFGNRILENIQKLIKLGINDQNTFAQRDSADRSKISETQLFDMPSINNENSQQDPVKKKNIPDDLLTKFKENKFQCDNEDPIQPKIVKFVKKTTTKTNLKKLGCGPRGKYKTIKQIRKNGMCHGLENYLMQKIKENFHNNGSMIERYMIKMFVRKYLTPQQSDVNHKVSESQTAKLLRSDGPEILAVNNKLQKILNDFYKELKRTLLQKLKRTSPSKKFTTKKHRENSLHVINETIDGSVKRKTDNPSKKSLKSPNLCKSEIVSELLVPHNDSIGTTEDWLKECSDDDSEYDSMFSSNFQTDHTYFEDST